MLNIKGATEITDTRLRRVLDAVDGYLYLGLPEYAVQELNSLDEKRLVQSTTMRARVRCFLHLKDYQEAQRLSKAACQLYPNEPEFSVQQVFALHKLSRLEEAEDVLLSAPEWLRESGLLHYNLACYEARLGDMETARECINVAFGLNSSFRKSAKKDPDLAGLWN